MAFFPLIFAEACTITTTLSETFEYKLGKWSLRNEKNYLKMIFKNGGDWPAYDKLSVY